MNPAVFTSEQLIQWLQVCAATLDENKEYLTALDAAIGDADHGTNIARGFGFVARQLAEQSERDIGTLLRETGMTLMSKVGGASGMLYGNFFMRAAATAAGKEKLSAKELATLLEAGLDGIIARGRAEAGDKTMVDVWQPAVKVLKTALSRGEELSSALSACTAAAEEGMKATIPLQAKKGRASYLGERSVGHQDPGATSTYLILSELKNVLD